MKSCRDEYVSGHLKAECLGLHESMVGGGGGGAVGVWYGVVSLVLVTIACLPWYGGWHWHAEGVTAHFSLPSLSICKAG